MKFLSLKMMKSKIQEQVAANLVSIVDHQLEIYGECHKFPDCPNLKENK